jgi:hypothetical protein
MIGIDTELAKYPWLDLVDPQIFLDGFDAEERHSQNISCSGSETGEPVQWA